jgi:hypothetical protein
VFKEDEETRRREKREGKGSRRQDPRSHGVSQIPQGLLRTLAFFSI